MVSLLRGILILGLLLTGLACSPRKFNSPAKGPTAVIKPFSCSTKSQNVALQVVAETTYGLPAADSVTFTERFKNFASASVDPKHLGDVSGEIDGAYPVMVNIYAPTLEDDSIDWSKATLEFTAQDSLSKKFDENGHWVEPYKIRFEGLESGDYKTKTPTTWLFADEAGELSIEWQVQSDGTWVGLLKFDNKEVFGSGSAEAGTLGAIKVAPCNLQRVPAT